MYVCMYVYIYIYIYICIYIYIYIDPQREQRAPVEEGSDTTLHCHMIHHVILHVRCDTAWRDIFLSPPWLGRNNAMVPNYLSARGENAEQTKKNDTP